MNAKLEFLLRFWDLAARHAAGGLCQSEEIEYLALLQLVMDDLEHPTLQRHKTQECNATLIGDGAIVSARVLTVSAGGLLVRAALDLEVGDSVLLSVHFDGTSEEPPSEVALPCTIAWVDGAHGMALRVDGAPVRGAHPITLPTLRLGLPRTRGMAA